MRPSWANLTGGRPIYCIKKGLQRELVVRAWLTHTSLWYSAYKAGRIIKYDLGGINIWVLLNI